MSLRTALEFNHAHFQKQQGRDFQFLLMQAIYHGREEDWQNLRLHYGVSRVYQCHHSDDRIEAMKAQNLPAIFRRKQ